MAKKMLINALHPEEARVAIVEDGQLIDLDIEIAGSEQTRGNVYKGVVLRVEPALQAAFIDIGLKKPGFLQAEKGLCCLQIHLGRITCKRPGNWLHRTGQPVPDQEYMQPVVWAESRQSPKSPSATRAGQSRNRIYPSGADPARLAQLAGRSGINPPGC